MDILSGSLAFPLLPLFGKGSTLAPLAFKVPITNAADNSLEYFFIVLSEKIILDISCESSARQRIHMKHQALFSSK